MPNENPDLKIAGLSLWIAGRQFPDAEEYWDGNWLNIFVRVSAPGASVEVQGPIVHLREIYGFAKELDELTQAIVGTARLKCIEPALSASIEIGSLGTGVLKVEATPNHLTQSHRFEFDIDQTEVSSVAKQCAAIIAEYQLRDAPEQGG